MKKLDVFGATFDVMENERKEELINWILDCHPDITENDMNLIMVDKESRVFVMVLTNPRLIPSPFILTEGEKERMKEISSKKL